MKLDMAAPGAGAPPAAPASVASAAPAGAAEPAPGAPPVDPVREQKAYQGAFDLLKTGQYEKAAEAFQAFLAEFPNGEFADNAQYWLAETFYVTRKFEPALAEFEKLIREHPRSQKLTHALLKIGYIYDELGRDEDARRVLGELVSRYPQTTAAGLARKRLQRLGGR